jgi:CRISPR type I-E-associated protein CasB/Cse2
VTLPAEALEEPVVFDLYSRLGFWRGDVDQRLSRVGVVACVLAHVRSPTACNERRRFAEVLGNGDPPLMSEIRFRRLLDAREDIELLTSFRRAVTLAEARNGSINVADVAVTLLDWSERRRTLCAFNYYNAGLTAPKLYTNEEETQYE